MICDEHSWAVTKLKLVCAQLTPSGVREEDGRIVAMQEAEPLKDGLGCDLFEIVGQGRSGSAPDTIA
jgi:hypothetical protein